jgi:hypothetical protein
MNNETVKCDACGEARQVSMPTATTIDSGWSLPYDTFGFYGGFTDNLDIDEQRQWRMCHACIVKFLDTFPLLAKSLEKGAHPCHYDEKPCCEYAWCVATNGDLMFANGGEWTVAPSQ